jgi:hypothetical protein
MYCMYGCVGICTEMRGPPPSRAVPMHRQCRHFQERTKPVAQGTRSSAYGTVVCILGTPSSGEVPGCPLLLSPPTAVLPCSPNEGRLKADNTTLICEVGRQIGSAAPVWYVPCMYGRKSLKFSLGKTCSGGGAKTREAPRHCGLAAGQFRAAWVGTRRSCYAHVTLDIAIYRYGSIRMWLTDSKHISFTTKHVECFEGGLPPSLNLL